MKKLTLLCFIVTLFTFQLSAQEAAVKISSIELASGFRYVFNPISRDFKSIYNSYNFEGGNAYEEYNDKFDSQSPYYVSNPNISNVKLGFAFEFNRVPGFFLFDIGYHEYNHYNSFTKYSFGYSNITMQDTTRFFALQTWEITNGKSIGVGYKVNTPLIFRCMNFSVGFGYNFAFGTSSIAKQEGYYYENIHSRVTGKNTTTSKDLRDSGTATNHFITTIGFNVGYELIIKKRIGLFANYLINMNHVNKLNYDEYDTMGDGFNLGLRYHFN